MQKSFKAVLDIIGINPFVFVPDKILQAVLKQARKEKPPIPVKGTVNDVPYQQTLVRYAGHWRLYINLQMLPNATKRIGETLAITIAYDDADRSTPFHPKLKVALKKNKPAMEVFNTLSPSHQKEINRYLNQLKTEESIERNINRALGYLLGENGFVGRPALKKEHIKMATAKKK